MHLIANNTVIKSRANRQNHIGSLHRHIRFVGPVHAQHAKKLPVCCRIATQSHQRIGHRETQQVGEFHQARGRVRQNHPTPGIDQGSFGIQQQLNRFLDLPRMAFNDGVV